MAIIATSSSDHGTLGVPPEPPAGFRNVRSRDRALAAFSNVVWQTHTVRHRPNPKPFPTRESLKANLPGIAWDLIIAASKIEEAAEDIPRARPAEGEAREHWLYGYAVPDASPNGNTWQRRRHEAVPTSELAEELLDPPAVQERDWRDTYAEELTSYPTIRADLEHRQGDGVEYVLERAGLTSSERLVMRGWLMGDDVAQVAEDLGWRPQTCVLLLRNGLNRLQDRRWAEPTRSALTRRSRPRTLTGGGRG